MFGKWNARSKNTKDGRGVQLTMCVRIGFQHIGVHSDFGLHLFFNVEVFDDGVWHFLCDDEVIPQEFATLKFRCVFVRIEEGFVCGAHAKEGSAQSTSLVAHIDFFLFVEEDDGREDVDFTSILFIFQFVIEFDGVFGDTEPRAVKEDFDSLQE